MKRVPSILVQRGRWELYQPRLHRVAYKIGHTAVRHNHQAAITISAGGDFVRNDRIAVFVFVHLTVYNVSAYV